MTNIFTFDTAGQVGNNPRTVRLVTNATLSEVTTAGFINQAELAPNALYSTDAILAIVGYDFETQSGGALAILSPTISSGVITLNEANTGSEVELPVVVGRLAVFTNLSGQIGDPFVTASHVGPLYLGQSGTAGYLRSYDTAPGTGAFVFQGRANIGNVFTTLRNNPMAQGTTINFPDPQAPSAEVLVTAGSITQGHLVAATGGDNGVVADIGAGLISGSTPVFAGGAVTHTFTIPAMTANCIIAANILSSTNSVSIQRVVPGAGTLLIEFSADPGANTIVNYCGHTDAV